MSTNEGGDSKTTIPFWNTNLPEDQWTDDCPDYLLEIDDRDEAQLSIRDEDYEIMKWDKVKKLVGWPALSVTPYAHQ